MAAQDAAPCADHVILFQESLFLPDQKSDSNAFDSVHAYNLNTCDAANPNRDGASEKRAAASRQRLRTFQPGRRAIVTTPFDTPRSAMLKANTKVALVRSISFLATAD